MDGHQLPPLPSALEDLPDDILAQLTVRIGMAGPGLRALILTSREIARSVLGSQSIWAAQYRLRWPWAAGPAGRHTSRQAYIDRLQACMQLRTLGPRVIVCSLPARREQSVVRHVALCGNIVVAARESNLALFSTDGVRAVSGSRHTGHITCMQAIAAPEGPLVVTGSEDRTLRIWSVPAWLPAPEPLDEHPASIRTAVGTGSSASSTQLPAPRTLRGHSEEVTCLTLLPGIADVSGGTCVMASGSHDSTVRLWPLSAQKPRATKHSSAVLRGHGGGVTCLAACPDVDVCSGSSDEKVKGWDATHAVCVATAKLSGAVLAICPSQDRPGMLLCALDKPEMQVVDLRAQHCGLVGTCSTGRVSCMALQGNTLLTGGGRACLWDIRKLSATCGPAEPLCQLWKPSTAQVRRDRLHVRCLHLDRHKAVIAPESGAGSWLPEAELPVHVHQTATGCRVASFWSDRSRASQEALRASQPSCPDYFTEYVSPLRDNTYEGEPEGHADEPTLTGNLLNDRRSYSDDRPCFDWSESRRHAGGDAKQRVQVTALWCSGAQLLTGNAAGKVMLRNFDHGVQPEAPLSDANEGASKFWDLAQRP